MAPNGAADVEDEKLERRMRDWTLAETAANDAAREARMSSDSQCDAVQPPQQQAERLRRVADSILDSILEDISTHRSTGGTPPPPRVTEPRRPAA
jgi:hypothetical protein